MCVHVYESSEEPTTLYLSPLKGLGFMENWLIPVLRQEMYKMGLAHVFVPEDRHAQNLIWPVKMT